MKINYALVALGGLLLAGCGHGAKNHAQYSDQVMSDAVYLQESWPTLERAEKRKIVECIANKIVISKEEITIDLLLSPLF